MPDNITGKNTGELTRITAAEVDAATHLLPWWNPDAIGADRTQAIVVNELVTLIRNLLGPTGQEVVLASANPAAAPTDNESVYIRRDTGDYWVAKADKSGWDGPFLAFTAGERSRLITIQSGATANSSDATLLDRANHTGTQAIATVSGLQSALDGKQPLDTDLTAIASLTTSGLIDRTGTGTATTRAAGTAGLQVLAAANAAAVRTAAGLGTIATQNANEVEITGGSAANLILKNTVIDSAVFQGASNVSVGRSAFFDRFAGADLRHTVAVTTVSGSPPNNPMAVFDPSTDSFATFAAGSVVQYEIDFGIEAPWTPNTNSGYTYVQGSFYVDQYFTDSPESVLGEFYIKYNSAEDQWVALSPINKADFAPNTRYTSRFIPPEWIYVKKARITVTAPASAVARIANFRYVPTRPSATETPTAIFSVGASTQKIFGAIEYRNTAGTSKTTIGQGTIRLNSGATLSQMLTATKTAAGTNPETITVTGAAVGDIAFISEAVPAKVTAANTVTFNGTGLTGTIRATVMRFS